MNQEALAVVVVFSIVNINVVSELKEAFVVCSIVKYEGVMSSKLLLLYRTEDQ